MRKLLIVLFSGIFAVFLSAQERMYIHNSNHITQGVLISNIDSVYFNEDGSAGYFKINGTVYQYWLCDIDSITFGNNSDTIKVNFDGSSASVINPLAFEGVSVKLYNASVYINATTETRDINYLLTGSTTAGMFKIYSEKRFNLIMNGVDITNSDGPAINIQSKNKATINLVNGTSNILTDGSIYASPVTDGQGLAEDQGAAFFSEGKLVFTGSGSITVNGKGQDKHAIACDDEVIIENGNITISSALKDGIHGKDGVEIDNGTINIQSTGDGIDGDEGYVNITGGNITISNSAVAAKGVTCDSILTVSGGTIKLTLGGDQSKGFKSDQKILFNGGDININTSGGVVLEASGSGYDPSYCTAIKGNDSVVVDGATVVIKTTGIAGKGISSDGEIIILSGSLNVSSSGNGGTYTNSTGTSDAYNATCLTSDSDISILGGQVTLSASGSGGKGISCDADLTIGTLSSVPTLNITTTGSKITISATKSTQATMPGSPSGQTSGDYDEAKAIKCDSTVSILNGNITINSADDGIKAKQAITIANATLSITNSVEGIESPSIKINSGNVSIIASDDGFNATYSTQSGGTESNDGSILSINGGYVVSSSSKGDAVDSNGNVELTGGTLIVHGPPSSPEEAMDFNGTFKISGGFLIAAGTNSNMNKAMSTTSTQNGIMATTFTAVAANNIFRIQDASGNDMVTFKAQRTAYSYLFSSPALVNGTYYIFTGGTCTGTEKDGLYTGGSYTGGTSKKSFTVSSTVTTVTF